MNYPDFDKVEKEKKKMEIKEKDLKKENVN